MIAASGKSAQQQLDEIHRLAQLDDFSADGYLRRFAEEITADPVVTIDDLEARDDRLRAGLGAIDGFTQRSMRIRLDTLLASSLAMDHSIGGPFRSYLASAVISYDADLGLLRERVVGAAARVDPRGADDTAEVIVEAARAVLATRVALRDALLGLARDLATATLPTALTAARDHGLADAVRLRWSAARRDLALIVEAPARVARHSFAERLKALPAVDEQPEEAPELTRGELIELY